MNASNVPPIAPTPIPIAKPTSCAPDATAAETPNPAPPILRNNPNFKNSFIEVWVMKGSKGDTQGSYLTNNHMKLLYKRCCGVCGYDAML